MTDPGRNKNPYTGEQPPHGEANKHSGLLDPLLVTYPVDTDEEGGGIAVGLAEQFPPNIAEGIGDSALHIEDPPTVDASEKVHTNETDVYRKHYDYNERTGKGSLE